MHELKAGSKALCNIGHTNSQEFTNYDRAVLVSPRASTNDLILFAFLNHGYSFYRPDLCNGAGSATHLIATLEHLWPKVSLSGSPASRELRNRHWRIWSPRSCARAGITSKCSMVTRYGPTCPRAWAFRSKTAIRTFAVLATCANCSRAMVCGRGFCRNFTLS